MRDSEEKSKDSWDKPSMITLLVLALIFTGGAALFGAIQNSKQGKLAEIGALEKFQAKLDSADPSDREFGLQRVCSAWVSIDCVARVSIAESD
jgi:hypothetical protein